MQWILLSGADDIDVMVHGLVTYNFFGHEVWITTTQVSLLLVMLILIVFSIAAGHAMKKGAEVPGGFQNVVELIVEKLDGIVDMTMGKSARKFYNYIGTVFIFLLVSNISGLLGLRPPTADYGVTFPLGVMTCVTGVSGSGKSSLVNEILYKSLAKKLNRARTIPGKHKCIEGVEQLDKIIAIDQSPIGRTPRSNPATYTGVFDLIRDLFASTADAKAKGYNKGRFSFNVKGGRCEACSGDGIIKIEMHFLPDIYVPCDVCKGARYNRETLDVRYKGKNIYEVLEMTVEEALGFFEHLPRLYNKLQTLYEVGLSYVKLGQPSTELSGGEAQRVKLATELAKRSTGKTIYILDEPTTGLHTADVHKLIEVLQKLVDAGNSVVVIEHNLDVIKTADHIIDLGPEGGDGGGGHAEGVLELMHELRELQNGKGLDLLDHGGDFFAGHCYFLLNIRFNVPSLTRRRGPLPPRSRPGTPQSRRTSRLSGPEQRPGW